VKGCEAHVLTGSTLFAFNRQTRSSHTDLYVARYTADASTGEAAEAWNATFGTSETEFGLGTAVDGDENVYMTGFTRGNLTGTNAGDYDVFVVKFSANGTRVWTRQVWPQSRRRAAARRHAQPPHTSCHSCGCH
jgi:hypothetical protein